MRISPESSSASQGPPAEYRHEDRSLTPGASARAARSVSTNERCSENKKQPKIPFDVLSDSHMCEVCKKPIKQRLVKVKKRPPRRCYRCFKAERHAQRNNRGVAQPS